MPACVTVDILIHNQVENEDYKKLTPPSLIPFDGKFIVSGGKAETMEGDWNPERIVVLEFSSLVNAKYWWNSEGYAPVKALRQRISHTKMSVVQGFSGVTN